MKRAFLAPLLVTAALLAPAAPLGADPGAPHGDASHRHSHVSTIGVDAQRAPTPREDFRLLRIAPDPIEGFNRGSFAVTKGVLDWVIHPLARGWRFVTPSFVRTGVDNLAYNLAFPVRFVSLLLQGELTDTGQETGHFLVNTTVGIAGLPDVAGPLGIPTHRADVGLSFARWGAGPGFYFVIPLMGPSSGRDALGKIFDTYDALSKSDLDLYGLVRAVWSLRRRIDATRYEIPAEAYATADPEPSLGVLAFRVKDEDFPGRAKEWSVASPRTKRSVPYSLWLQPGPAPIVYVIPGIGAHRRSTNPVALAELGYARGYSVAVVSSPFHPEFILTGLTSVYPGYTPDDAEDLAAVFGAIRRRLDESRPGRVGSARLLGYSMGALEKANGEPRDALWNEANLRLHESWLRDDARVRAFTNRNDFILGADNLAWLAGVLGDRLVVFPEGGHLGNLHVPAVHEKILDALGPSR